MDAGISTNAMLWANMRTFDAITHMNRLKGRKDFSKGNYFISINKLTYGFPFLRNSKHLGGVWLMGNKGWDRDMRTQ